MISQSKEFWGMAAGAAATRPAREMRAKERIVRDESED